MLNRTALTAAIGLLLGGATLSAQLQVPPRISYQGILTQTSGTPVANGNYTMTFALYDDPNGTTGALWSESQTITITSGLFNTMLGSVQPLLLPFDQPYYLGIRINNGPEMRPLAPLAGAPYAFHARTADTSNYAAPGSVNNPAIIDGAVTSEKISSYGSTAGQVLTSTGTGVEWTNPSSGGVSSVNGIIGPLTIRGGSNTTVQKLGNELVISSTAGISSVNSADAALAVANPTGPAVTLTLVPGGITSVHLANFSVTSSKIAPGAITADKLSSEITISPMGPAGGDLTGTYPNPTIASAAVTTNKIATGAVTNDKIFSVDYSKITGAPTFLPPGGPAGGDLSGTYPNPFVANGAITTSKIADGAVTSLKIADGTIGSADIADNAIGFNHIGEGAVTDSKIVSMSYSKLTGAPTSLPPSGAAGGDLTGTYPNPAIANAAVTTNKIAVGAITMPLIASGAVTDDKVAFGISYSKLSGAPTSLPPSGAAGGDLTGTYPNPEIAIAAVTSTKIADGAVTSAKIQNSTIVNEDVRADAAIAYTKLNLNNSIVTGDLTNGSVTTAKLADSAVTSVKIKTGAVNNAHVADGAITNNKVAFGIDYAKLINTPSSLPPSGPAGGDLTGTYPNPTVATSAITTAKIADGAVTDPKITSVSYSKVTGAPTSLPPNGPAGGDLTGTYPNPTVATSAITTSKIADGAVTDAKVANGISYSKLSGAPTSLPPNGPAGGDLTGAYPNPTVATSAITTSKIADGAVTTSKLADSSVTAVKIGASAVTNGHIVDGAVTNNKVAFGIDYAKLVNAPTSLPPNGPAGGDLTGSYPNPLVGNAAITTNKIADGAVTDAKVAFGISYSKLAGAPTSLPPNGPAGGDLTGSYPNPTVAASTITSAKIVDGTIVNADVSPTASIAYSKLNLVNSIETGDLRDSSVTSVKIKTGAVNNAHVADGAITNNKVAFGIDYAKLINTPSSLPPSGPAGGDLTGTYPNPVVAASAITTSKIADGAVTTPKIADGAVTSLKIADGAITNSDINVAAGIAYSKLNLTNSIVTNDLTNGSVTTSKLADSAVTSVKLGTAAVNMAHIADGAVTDPKITSVSYSKVTGAPTSLPPNGPAGGDLTGMYPNPMIANGVVTSLKIADGSITNADVNVAAGIAYGKLNLTNSIVTSDLTNGSVTTSKLADSAVTSLKLGTAAVNTAHIADGAVTDAKVANGISYSKLSGAPTSLPPSGAAGGDLTGTYPNPVIGIGTVTSTKIADGAITNADVNVAAGIAYGKLNLTNSIVTSDLTNGSVTTSKLADSAVSGLKLGTSAVNTAHIADGAVTDPKITSVSYSKVTGAPTSLPPSGAAGGDLTGTYPNPVIGIGTVTSAKIADGSITNADVSIAAGIAYPKLNLTNSIVTSDLTNGSVTTSKLADSAVTSLKLGTAAVNTAHIANGAVTDAKVANGISYSKLSGAPTSLPPSGSAGGDLSGTYPNPSVSSGAITTAKLADGAVTTPKIADGAVTNAKVANGIDYAKLINTPTALPPSGAAGGDLTGTYPNPDIAGGAVGTSEIANGAVTDAKVANGISYSKLSGAPTSLPPSGSAGGDLTGTYPNPTVASSAITSGKIADGAVTTAKIADSAVTSVKIKTGAVNTAHIADGAVTNAKVANGIDYAKLINTPTALPPSGTAGGDLTGTYPNPTVANGAITDAKVANGISYSKLSGAPTSLPPNGPAGGDLTGTYPNPVVASSAITTSKIADGAVTTAKLADSAVTSVKIKTGAVNTAHIADGAVTNAKVANGIDYAKLINTPTSLPPGGTAGGDLTGTYPNPDIAANAVGTSEIANGAVTDAKVANGISYSKLSGAPTSLPPSGSAGGDLSGSYPNPVVATNAITTGKIANGAVTTTKLADSAVTSLKLGTAAVNTAHVADGAITNSKVAFGIDYAKLINTPSGLPPSGAAGGDLTGTYPNPDIATGAVGTGEIANGAVTDAKVANGISYSKLSGAPTSLPPSGAAGGDLTGTYPNPDIAANAVGTSEIANGAVTDAKVANGISYSKLSGAPTSLPPSGSAGGDLTGTYPNPNIAASAVGTTEIANSAVTTAKLADSAVTSLKLGTAAVKTAHIADGAVTNDKVASGIDYAKLINTPSGLPPSGTAGGDLTGTYPNPTIGSGAVTSAKIANGTITNIDVDDNAAIEYSKLNLANSVKGADMVDATVTDAKIAPGISYSKLLGAPTSLPPNGSAGGDLTGTYPNPTIASSAVTTTTLANSAVTTTKIADSAVTTAKINPTGATSGQVLTFDGTNVTWASAPGAGGLTLPYSGSVANASTAFAVTNTGTGNAGRFTVNNAANATNALEASTNGSGYAASFTGTGASSQGVKIEAGAGEIGLNIVKGRTILSYASVNDNETIPSDVSVVLINDNGVGGVGLDVTLPATTELGQIMFIFNNDANSATINNVSAGPNTVNSEKLRTYIYTSIGWIAQSQD